MLAGLIQPRKFCSSPTHHTVEDAALVALDLALLVLVLSGAESPEILRSCRYYIHVELHLDAAERPASECDVEEDDRVFGSSGWSSYGTRCKVEVCCISWPRVWRRASLVDRVALFASSAAHFGEACWRRVRECGVSIDGVQQQ